MKNNEYNKEENFKKYLKMILDKTSEKMNHTASVCKKEYLMPQWFLFEDGEKLKNYVKNHDFPQTIKYISHID